MKRLLTQPRIDALRRALDDTPGYLALLEAMEAKLRRETRHPGIMQPEDTTAWWYHDDRLQRAAAVLCLRWDDALAAWLVTAVDDILSRDADEWVGPFFRQRTTPPQGTLECSRLTRTLAYVLMLCPQVLDEERQARTHAAIAEIGMPMMLEWMRHNMLTTDKPRNNFCPVILCGYMAGALALEDAAALDWAVAQFDELFSLLNTDFYGETPHYWSYATTQYAEMYTLLRLAAPEQVARIAEPGRMYGAFRWAYAHRAGAFVPESIGQVMPRMLNFGDSGAMDRPLGTLLSVAASGEDIEIAAMASEWFHFVYSPDRVDPPMPDRIGFYNDIGPWPLLLYPDFASPNDVPAQPSIQRFGDGYASVDVAGLRIGLHSGGTEAPRVMSHRHADQQSLIASLDGVVLLDDPGHCCYRLPLQKAGMQDGAHSTPVYLLGDEPLAQRMLGGTDVRQPPRNVRTRDAHGDDWLHIGGDAAALYPAPVRRAERRFLALGAHVLLIEDIWAADAPLRAGMRFVCNNRAMGLALAHGPAGDRLSREGVAARILPLWDNEAELGYVALHDNYHVFPAAPVQGREGSGMVVTHLSKEEATTGAIRALLVFDRDGAIDHWRIEAAGDAIEVFSPDGARYARIDGAPATAAVFGASILPL